MADTNQSAQELADAMERVNREMFAYGQIHKSTAAELQDASMKAKYGITNFTKGTETVAEAFTSVAKAGTAAAGAMYEGKKGAAAFNSSIDELSNAAKLAGAALTLLVPGGPIMKLFIAGITAAATATAEYVKKSNEMADKLYNGYNKLQKSGAAAGDGMTGVYQGAKKLGLSMNELDSYVGLVGENANDLSLFAGSVFEGRKKFEDMGAAMEPYRKGLIAAGYTQQEINDASMQYLRLQTRIGASQNMTTKELAEGAKKYLTEQDALTKLTGMSRKEQEQALEAARSQQRFRAKLEEMRGSGDEKQIAAADEMETTYKMLYKRSKEAATGYGDLATGMMGTEAAMKLYQSTQGEAMTILDKQKAGQLDGIKAFEQTGKAVGRVTKEMNYLYQMGVGEEFGLKINEGAELGIAANKDLSEEYAKVKEEQKRQGMEGAKAADGITDQYAANIKKQQELNKSMEDAVFKGISNAQAVTTKLAGATETLTGAFSTLTTGINKLLRILGLGEKVDKVAEKQQEVASASKSLETAKAAQKSAKTPEEKAAADREVKFYDEKMKLLEQEKATLAAEDKNSKLDAQILKRADDELAIKKAAYDKAMETATLKQKMGFGLDKDQEKARTEMWESVAKQRALQRNEGGARDQARAEAAKAGGAAPGGGSAKSASAPTQTSQKQLSEAGLKIKTGDVQAEGAVINPKIIEMAEQIQANMPNFGYFSSFNDKFHQEKAPTSLHAKGNALDFTLSKAPTPKEGADIVKYLQSMGASLAIDEYNNPSSKATAGHIHAQINAYADGGIAETPQIAFVGEKGPEVMLPLGADGSLPITIKGTDSGSAAKPQLIDFPEDIKKFFQLQGQLDSLRFLQDTGGKDTYVDQAPEVAGNQAKMFAELADMKLQLTNQGWDKQLLENYGEEPAKDEPVDLQERYKDDEMDSGTNNQAIVDTLKEGAAQTSQLVSMLAELIREQKTQNDISTRILQVSSN